MKKSKKNYLIVALIVILLALAVGYAAFTQQLQIIGTAKAKGSWDIHFTNETIDVGDAENTAVLSNEDHTLTVNVALKKPGDTKTVTVDIVNEGTVDATLKGFTIVAQDGSSQTISGTGGVYTYGAIKMTLEELSIGTDLVAKTGSKTYTMTFEWPSNYTANTAVDDTATFTITFDYTQKTA